MVLDQPQVGVDHGSHQHGELIQPTPVLDEHVQERLDERDVPGGDVAACRVPHQVPAEVVHVRDGVLDHLPQEPEKLRLDHVVEAQIPAREHRNTLKDRASYAHTCPGRAGTDA